MLKDSFYNLLNNYSSDNELTDSLWDEIYVNYSHPDRHYHNLSHLENVITELLPVEMYIEDWDTVLFAVFYHDLVYNPASTKNEEDSAEIARQRLLAIGYPAEKISKCSDMIIATKGHSTSLVSDINYFLDADLSILGKTRDLYFKYSEKIRKEYTIYPAPVYIPARRRVLQGFLNMDRIFKTKHFYKKYEIPAKQNINEELERLK